jgi:hypothetical protein
LPFEVQRIPGTTDWAESYMRDWSVSYTAGIATWSDESGVIRVLRFEEAP